MAKTKKLTTEQFKDLIQVRKEDGVDPLYVPYVVVQSYGGLTEDGIDVDIFPSPEIEELISHESDKKKEIYDGVITDLAADIEYSISQSYKRVSSLLDTPDEELDNKIEARAYNRVIYDMCEETTANVIRVMKGPKLMEKLVDFNKEQAEKYLEIENDFVKKFAEAVDEYYLKVNEL